MKFHRADGDVELGRDLFVRSIAEDGAQNFLLPWTQGRRTVDLAAHFQKILGSRNEAARQVSIGRHEDCKIFRLLSPNQALHREQTGDALQGAPRIRERLRPELRDSRGLLAKNKYV